MKSAKKAKAQRFAHEGLRCLRCVCALENEEAVWCVKLKRAPTNRDAKDCPFFVAKGQIFGKDAAKKSQND